LRHEVPYLFSGLLLHLPCDVGVGAERKACVVVTQHAADGFHIHTVLQCQRCEGMAQVMEAPASGGTAFDRAKAARKRARAAPVTHFIADSRQNDCTRCAKEYVSSSLPLLI